MSDLWKKGEAPRSKVKHQQSVGTGNYNSFSSIVPQDSCPRINIKRKLDVSNI
jgi:hypothetical protein